MADPCAGSFCSAPPGSARTSTIGAEKTSNALLGVSDADTFTRLLIAGLGSYPAYFAWLSKANRRGPAVVDGDPALAPLTADEVRAQVTSGAVVVDVRPITDVAKGHVPGAVSIALRPQFATWLGWVIEPGTSVIIVRDDNQRPADILWPAYNIGYTHFAGELTGGMPAWTAAGHPVVTAELAAPVAVTGRVLDLRQDSEYAAGHLPQAIHLELGDLARNVAEAPNGPLTVMCGHGERAMTAATLLQCNGSHDVAVMDGGAGDWAKAAGRALEHGA